MAQDKKKKGTAEDLMLPTPETSGDPMLAGTGQPGELANTPTSPSQEFLDTMRLEEAGIEQDPMLRGTGQPGELYGAPEKPSDSFLEAQERAARRKASIDVGKDFSIWDITEDLELDFNPFKREEE